MDVHTIETPSLGDRTYVLSDGEAAAIIDPQRDIDRVLDVVDRHELTVTSVFETHIHNDYVTGGLHLAEETGAAYHVNAADEVDYRREPIVEGDEVPVGKLTIRAVATPGHTPTHLSYVATDEGGQAVFTGGSMLYGSVGRTDLVGEHVTRALTRSQYRSVRRLADLLADDVDVWPTHGFGSFCSTGDTTGATTSTIGVERRDNQALTTDSEEAFVKALLAGLDAWPAYYAHMAPINRAGPPAMDLSPVAEVGLDELVRRVASGEWVVDLRPRHRFAAAHLPGTVNIELADSSSTHLGWLMPWGTRVTLMAEAPDIVEAMRRQLVRIGIDRPDSHVVGSSLARDEQPNSYRVTDFAGLRGAVDAGEEPWLLDIRRNLEWHDGHISGAHHVPLHELEDRIDEVPRGREVWVHCGTGYRAGIGASLLARADRTPVLVDGDFDADARPLFDVVHN